MTYTVKCHNKYHKNPCLYFGLQRMICDICICKHWIVIIRKIWIIDTVETAHSNKYFWWKSYNSLNSYVLYSIEQISNYLRKGERISPEIRYERRNNHLYWRQQKKNIELKIFLKPFMYLQQFYFSSLMWVEMDGFASFHLNCLNFTL